MFILSGTERWGVTAALVLFQYGLLVIIHRHLEVARSCRPLSFVCITSTAPRRKRMPQCFLHSHRNCALPSRLQHLSAVAKIITWVLTEEEYENNKTRRGARTRDHKIKSLALCQLSLKMERESVHKTTKPQIAAANVESEVPNTVLYNQDKTSRRTSRA